MSTIWRNGLFVAFKCFWTAEGLVGGQAARSGQFTYLVSVQADSQHLCGGGLIEERFVLSAAHCFVEKEGRFKEHLRDLSVIAGAVDLLDPQASKRKVAIEKVYVPREYGLSGSPNDGQQSSADIAVIKLIKNIDLLKSPPLRKLELPNRSHLSYEEEVPFISGFGCEGIILQRNGYNAKTSVYPSRITYKLRYAAATVMSNKECARKLHNLIGKNHLCAQMEQVGYNHDAEGVCVGDSGGPLVLNGVTLIGVLSVGNEECDERYFPAVYTRVSFYLPLIQKAMQDLISPDIDSFVYFQHK